MITTSYMIKKLTITQVHKHNSYYSSNQPSHVGSEQLNKLLTEQHTTYMCNQCTGYLCSGNDSHCNVS